MGKKLTSWERMARRERKAAQRRRNARAAEGRRAEQRIRTARRKEKERAYKAHMAEKRKRRRAKEKAQETSRKLNIAEKHVRAYDIAIHNLKRLHNPQLHNYDPQTWSLEDDKGSALGIEHHENIVNKNTLKAMANIDLSSDPETHSIPKFKTKLVDPTAGAKKAIEQCEKEGKKAIKKCKNDAQKSLEKYEKNYNLSFKEYIRANKKSGFFLFVLLDKTSEKYEKFINDNYDKHKSCKEKFDKDLPELKTKIDKDIATLKAKFDKDLPEYNRKLKKEKETHAQEVERINKENEKIIADAKEAYKKQSADMNKFFTRLADGKAQSLPKAQKEISGRINFGHEYILLFSLLFPLDFIYRFGSELTKNNGKRVILEEFGEEENHHIGVTYNPKKNILFINLNLNMNFASDGEQLYFLNEYGAKMTPSGGGYSQFKHSQKFHKEIGDTVISSLVLAYANTVFQVTHIDRIDMMVSHDSVDPATGENADNILLVTSIDRFNFEQLKLSKVDPVAAVEGFKTVSKSIHSSKELKIPSDLGLHQNFGYENGETAASHNKNLPHLFRKGSIRELYEEAEKGSSSELDKLFGYAEGTLELIEVCWSHFFEEWYHEKISEVVSGRVVDYEDIDEKLLQDL